MSETFNIISSIKTYQVSITCNETLRTINAYSDLIVIDANVNKLWPTLGIDNPIELHALENKKSLETVAEIVENLRDKGATRQSSLLAIGGGITQDICTFSASCYMRGIKWVYFPTTLLGMVDSCIGGKSSINVGKYKNIAGNFFPPEKVIIDVSFCNTLSEQQLVEGLCEAVKICYANSYCCFQEYLSLVGNDVSLHNYSYSEIVKLSLSTKKRFIEDDEFDNGIRLLLNFGHTFGHALEGASQFKISHGIAVGLGMICAFKLSALLGLVVEEPKPIKQLLMHVNSLLSKVKGLEDIINEMSMDSAVENFRSDKKHEKSSFWAILFDQDGELIRHKFAKSSENECLILASFQSLLGYTNEI